MNKINISMATLISKVDFAIEFSSESIYKEYLHTVQPQLPDNPAKPSIDFVTVIDDNLLNSMPHTKKFIEEFGAFVNYDQASFRNMIPNSTYTVHNDKFRWQPINYHVPIKTHRGCYFVYPSVNDHPLYTLDENSIYECCVSKNHTFINASPHNRIHLTFEKMI